MIDAIAEKAMRDSAQNRFDPPHIGNEKGWHHYLNEEQAEEQRRYSRIWEMNRENLNRNRGGKSGNREGVA